MKAFAILWIVLVASISPNTENQKLSGNWFLVCFENLEVNQRDCRPQDDWQNGRLTFEFSDNGKQGEIRGKTTSNSVFGTYQLGENQAIEVKKFGGTRVLERGWGKDLSRTIKQASSYKYFSDTLRLYYDSNKCMVFVPYQSVKEGEITK
ncbi:META domain-containing protein [Flavobacteriales bacterium]|nr:META domain-containing protein [Flavobacteriales bacterium]